MLCRSHRQRQFRKEPADDLLTQEGGDTAAERWQFCHTASAARDAWATKLALTFTPWTKSWNGMTAEILLKGEVFNRISFFFSLRYSSLFVASANEVSGGCGATG